MSVNNLDNDMCSVIYTIYIPLDLQLCLDRELNIFTQQQLTIERQLAVGVQCTISALFISFPSFWSPLLLFS